MTDHYTPRIHGAIVEGRDLDAAEAGHLATCGVCREAADRASAFSGELEAALARRRSEPLPADPLSTSSSTARRPWAAAAVAGTVLLAAITAGALGARFIATPSPSPSPAPSASTPVVSPAPTAVPSPTDPLDQIGAGTLAVVNAPAAVLDEPGGEQWALLEPDHTVLVIDVLHDGQTEWYRVEFEFCCDTRFSAYEWVFGWVAADLETAGLSEPGFGIEPPEVLAGPTLTAVEWSCPERLEDLYLLAEPVRHLCYDDAVTFSGVLGGGEYGEALYPGDPPQLTGLPNATLVPTGMESGYRLLPLHLPTHDQLVLAWLNDERVKRGDEVEVTGYFGAGAMTCTKSPRLDGFPPMTAEEQQLWCEQQFTVTEIHGDGPDPIVNAPVADPLWTPPAGVQPVAGDGWRLLASSTRNQLAVTVASEAVSVAMDVDEYRRLWLSQASGDPPPVDFDREFVIQFVPPVSGSCPWIAFTGVGTKPNEGLMYGTYEYLSAELFLDEVPDNFGCTTDATPHAFLVAVEDRLGPGRHFRLRLQEDRLCEDCGITWDETVVHLDDSERVP